MASNGEKSKAWKGHSRTLHVCHWCTKSEKDSDTPFQACSACKEVIYCSKECQKKSWPIHKRTCELNKQSREMVDNAAPSEAKDIRDLKKWHGLNVKRLVAAIVCALDLGEDPSRINNHAVFLEVDRKPNHASLPADKKFDPVGGFTLTDEELQEMLGRQPGGQTIIDSGKEASQIMQKKGAVGVATLMLQYKKTVDVVRVIIPNPKSAKKLQDALHWGENWVNGLRFAIETEFTYN